MAVSGLVKPSMWGPASQGLSQVSIWHNGLLAYFPAWEKAGSFYSVANGLSCPVSGTWEVGPYGPQMEFTRNTQNEEGTTQALTILNSNYVTVWVRVRLTSTITGWRTVAQKAWSSHTDPFYTWSLMFRLGVPEWRWWLALDDGTEVEVNLLVSGNEDTEWVDLMGTWDGTSQRLFVREVKKDSVRSAERSDSGTLNHANTGITIGGFRNLSGSSYDSDIEIAGVGVWNYGFTESQAKLFLKDPFAPVRMAVGPEVWGAVAAQTVGTGLFDGLKLTRPRLVA